MKPEEGETVVPVIREEVHASAVPVQTGGVRVTKSLEHHEELLEQELRKGHADVRRVKVNRVVDGPQEPRRVGNTLVIPVVSEVLDGCEKRWQVTEEIHVIQREETEVLQQKVNVAQERVRVERFDAQGNVVAVEPETVAAASTPLETPVATERPATPVVTEPRARLGSSSIVNRREAAGDAVDKPVSNKVLSSRKSILQRRTKPDKP